MAATRLWLKSTPPKTNMEPENTLLEKEKILHTTNFWVSSKFSGVYPQKWTYQWYQHSETLRC